MTRQIGYAVIGLDEVARTSIVPAFARASEHARLVAVVARDRTDVQAVAADHKAAVYTLEEYRHCLQRDDVQAVWLTVPTSMRSEYAVEAARAGVHILCEAPMAVTADECRRMMRTCQTNRVKLMIGYRLHFQPVTRKALALVRAGHIGALKTFSSDFTRLVVDPEDIRLQRRLGGGTLYDLGVHALNTARTLFAAEPAQVMAMTARTSGRYTGDVDESAVALVRFPDERLAHFHTSFGEEPTATYTLLGDEASLQVHAAYEPRTAARITIVRGGQREELDFEATDEFVAELVHFSRCVAEDRDPEPSAFEGLQDVRTVEAIYRSARDGRPVTLPRVTRGESAPLVESRTRR